MKILILRPQPGADETADRARALGLEPLVAPLFTLRPLSWESPAPSGFDAVLLTSASAPRLGGDGLASFVGLPCYAVGERTAVAAGEAGFRDIRIGPSDGGELAAMALRERIGAAIHFCGRDHVALGPPVSVEIAVYTAEATGRLPEGVEEALVLLHSPRAATHLAGLVGALRGAIRIAAISGKAAAAAGPGWRSVHVASAPRDQALLELAAKLCQTGMAI